MSEIAKCPLCGMVPGWHDFDIEARIFGGERSYFCCGTKASTAVLWNRYAAAMELAKTIVESENCKAEDEYKYQEFVEWARQYVLEVFK